MQVCQALQHDRQQPFFPGAHQRFIHKHCVLCIQLQQTELQGRIRMTVTTDKAQCSDNGTVRHLWKTSGKAPETQGHVTQQIQCMCYSADSLRTWRPIWDPIAHSDSLTWAIFQIPICINSCIHDVRARLIHSEGLQQERKYLDLENKGMIWNFRQTYYKQKNSYI